MFYSNEMVNLLQQLRSRVQSEFGLRIRLADPDLLSCLGDLGHRSRDPFTRKTIVELMRLAELPYEISPKPRQKSEPTEVAEPAKTTEITYRGQKIVKDSTTPQSAQSRPSKQIYRGQVVNN